MNNLFHTIQVDFTFDLQLHVTLLAMQVHVSRSQIGFCAHTARQNNDKMTSTFIWTISIEAIELVPPVSTESGASNDLNCRETVRDKQEREAADNSFPNFEIPTEFLRSAALSTSATNRTEIFNKTQNFKND